LNPNHNLAGNELQKLFLTYNFAPHHPHDSVVTEVLQHRIVLSYQAQAENMSVKAIIKQILEAIQVP
jgi:MoxR-like ATPase